MKKVLGIFLASILVLSCVLTACNFGDKANETTYKVTFDTQGGSTVKTQTVISGEKAIEPKDPTYAAKEFAGWSKNKDTYEKFDFDSAITKDTTVYAIWKTVDLSFKITFDSQGGSTVRTQTVLSGEKATEPKDPTYTGKEFAGWSKNKDTYEEFDFDSIITGNITLYAIWSGQDLVDVGISLPTAALQRWNQDGAALKKAFEDKGFSVDLKYAGNSVSTQINDIENMVIRGVKVLVIAAIEGSALGRPLEKAKAKGVVVIAYDRLLMNTPDVDYWVSFDNFKVGVTQGKYIEDKLGLKTLPDGQSKTIEFVTGDPGDSNARLLYDGAMSILEPYLDAGKLKCLSTQTAFTQVTTAGWSTAAAQSRFENIIASVGYNNSDKKLDAICASNDSTAQGATAAFKQVYPTKDVFPILTGMDCDKVNVKNIINGFQSMSVFKDTRILAAQTIRLVAAILDGKTEVDLINEGFLNSDIYHNNTRLVWAYMCETIVVTRENYMAALIDSGYYRLIDIT